MGFSYKIINLWAALNIEPALLITYQKQQLYLSNLHEKSIVQSNIYMYYLTVNFSETHYSFGDWHKSGWEPLDCKAGISDSSIFVKKKALYVSIRILLMTYFQ